MKKQIAFMLILSVLSVFFIGNVMAECFFLQSGLTFDKTKEKVREVLSGNEFADDLPDDGQDTVAAREAKQAPFKTVGSHVTFGAYPQTASGTDSTSIEWIVLDYDTENNRALLISRYGLDSQPYNTSLTDITWEKCTLRTWLNDLFLNEAFTAEEQAAILTMDVDNGSSQGYSEWSTNGGNNTQDRIFLLSYAEANKYFGVTYDDHSNMKSRVAPTAYAIGQRAFGNDAYKTVDYQAAGWWWLRSPGGSQQGAAFVRENGALLRCDVNSGRGCVRPALWINLESDIF